MLLTTYLVCLKYLATKVTSLRARSGRLVSKGYRNNPYSIACGMTDENSQQVAILCASRLSTYLPLCGLRLVGNYSSGQACSTPSQMVEIFPPFSTWQQHACRYILHYRVYTLYIPCCTVLTLSCDRSYRAGRNTHIGGIDEGNRGTAAMKIAVEITAYGTMVASDRLSLHPSRDRRRYCRTYAN